MQLDSVEIIGEYAFVSLEGSLTLSNNSEVQTMSCYQCGKKLRKGEARNHVGLHILKAMRGVSEDLTGQPVSHPGSGFLAQRS